MKPKTIQVQGRRAKAYTETERIIMEIGRNRLHQLRFKKEEQELLKQWNKLGRD